MWWNFVLYLLLLLIIMIMISKVALLNPNCYVLFFNFNFISWLVYYPFVCALFVINWIKWTSTCFYVLYSGVMWSQLFPQVIKYFINYEQFDPLILKEDRKRDQIFIHQKDTEHNLYLVTC